MSRRPLQRVQAALAAKMHFIEQKTKSQIADDLGISRFKVARLIEAAIDKEIIRFVISEPDDLNVPLGEALRRKYGLSAALVLDGPDLQSDMLTEPLGNLAASFLDEVLEDGQLLGIAWGRTIAATARALTHLPKVDVVQTGGTPAGVDIAQNPIELVHRFSALSGGKAYPIYSPMWAEDDALIARLRAEPTVANAMSRYDQVDVLLVGIGSWSPERSGLASAFPKAWRDRAMAAGVQADICGTLIDAEGIEIPSELSHHGLAIDGEQIRKIPSVVGIGGGLEKTRAIEAALKGRWINTLITDAGVARRLV